MHFPQNDLTTAHNRLIIKQEEKCLSLRKCVFLVSLGRFYHDTWAEVNLDHLADNVKQMKKLLPKDVKMIAVVKANAYGHGDYQVAKVALEQGASYLAVAFMDEALALRQRGITAPILVLGASRPSDVNLAAEQNIILTIFQKEWLQIAKENLKEHATVSVHIKLDTGMGRIGVRDVEELKLMEAMIAEDERIQLEGAYTHFASSDTLECSYFEEQLHRFETMIAALSKRPSMLHASNSAASLRSPSAYFNGIRFGVAMYGLTPSLEIQDELPFPLKQTFSLHSRLIHVKKMVRGEKISYGSTYEVQDEEEWIGTIPIGYADGWIRKLQGQEVLVNGMRSQIVGRICMDQCMIKLPYDVAVGTEVTLIGEDQAEYVTMDEIAERLETINYEIPCLISNRVPRVYKQAGKVIGMENSILQ